MTSPVHNLSLLELEWELAIQTTNIVDFHNLVAKYQYPPNSLLDRAACFELLHGNQTKAFSFVAPYRGEIPFCEQVFSDAMLTNKEQFLNHALQMSKKSHFLLGLTNLGREKAIQFLEQRMQGQRFEQLSLFYLALGELQKAIDRWPSLIKPTDERTKHLEVTPLPLFLSPSKYSIFVSPEQFLENLCLYLEAGCVDILSTYATHAIEELAKLPSPPTHQMRRLLATMDPDLAYFLVEKHPHLLS